MASVTPTLQPPGSANGPAKADSPVPLDTIPISPADGNGASIDGAERQDGPAKDLGENEQITVFHDANNFNVKHPLMHKWTLWFTKPASGRVSCPRLECA